MNTLRAWYAGLQQREQRMVTIGAIGMAALFLVMAVLVPLQSAVSTAVKRSQTKREDLAWMQANAATIRAGGNQFAADTGEAPVVLVDRIARELGLAAALRGTQPNGTGVRVQLEGAPFDILATWLGKLDENYGLAVESITVDRASRPGVVNASITFTQPRL
ncbi:MAG: type II secretion system protein M [Pseudomonadota bacterium]|nr:type II secretion system protein M [Pseudomonadota bacterium]